MDHDETHGRGSGVFAPDTLLPGQYFDRIRRRSDLSGEQSMMVAVLEMGIEDFQKHAAARDRLRQNLFAEAERWIESTDRTWLYAFETICDHLGLDVDYMRRGLRAWRDRLRGDASDIVIDDVPSEETAPERRRAGNE